jgi:hypothetical protein
MPIANALVSSDVQLRQVGTTNTQTGAAQTKGTATDLQLTVISLKDGNTAVGGQIDTILVQGSSVTSSAAANWTNVTPDKGTFALVSTSGAQQVVHLAQLQYQYYRIQVVANSSATIQMSANWSFQNLQDSVSNTQQ